MKKTPQAFLLALLIISLSQALLVYYDNELYWDLRNGVIGKIKNEFSQVQDNQFDVLFMGDCYLQTGVDPRLFDRLTGLSSFNFSLAAYHTIISTYIMFKNYLAASPPPKYLVIGFVPGVWTQSQELVRKDYWDVFYDFRQGNTWLIFKELGFTPTLKLFIPLLKHQHSFKTTPLKTFAKRITQKDSVDQIVFKNTFKFHGLFYPSEWKDQVADFPQPPSACGPSEPSPLFKKYLESIAGLALSKNVQILYIIPSAPPEWSHYREECRTNQSIKNYLSSLVSRYPNVTILDPQQKINRKFLYHDEVHLNRYGISRLSQILATYINLHKHR